jgi:hypothetical protein
VQDLILLPSERCQDSDDDMKLRDDDKKWLADEIEKQIKQTNATLADSLKPHGLRNAVFWLRQLGPIATSISIVVTLLGITLAAVYYSVSNVKEETRFRTTTERRLGDIEKGIEGIKGELAKQSLVNHASLPLPDFKASLPALRSDIAVAKQQNVKLSPAVMGNLGEKLTASIDAPQFWPAAADFINYRSQIVVKDIESLMRSDLPSCTDQNPTPMELTVSDGEARNGRANDTAKVSDLLNETDKNKTHMKSAVYQNCRFTLDSPEETARIPNLGEQRSYVLTFRHCQIVYRGGQVNLLTPNPRPTAITGISHERSDVYIFVGQVVRFENCLFVFVMNSQPPREGQWLTEQLLTQGGPILTVKTPKSATRS